MAWMAVSFLVALGVVVLIYPTIQLNQIPDIGSPFANTELLNEIQWIDNRDNALMFYDAIQLTSEPDEYPMSVHDWASVPNQCKQWLNENQVALAMLEAAAEKPGAMPCLPKEHDLSNMLHVTHHRSLSRLVRLEISRSDAEEGADQSRRWMRVAFRHSRHCGMAGAQLDRLVGKAFHASIVETMIAWAANPNVDAKLLRQALDEVRNDFEMTPSPSVTLMNSYYLNVNSFDPWAPSLEQPKRNYLKEWWDHEPERGWRLVNLVYANWMLQIDLTAYQQERLPGSQFGLFVDSIQRSKQMLDAETLEQLCRSSSVATYFFRYKTSDSVGERMEMARQQMLEVILIAQIYFRQHNRYPLSTEAFDKVLLPSWPIDPSSAWASAIGYRTASHGFTATIWCAGYDGKDDGGVIDTNPNEEIHDHGYTFTSEP